MCSTLPSLPGMTVRLARSIISGAASIQHLFSKQTADLGPATHLPQLITKGHAMLKQQAAAMGCNAVIGITIAICSDSSGGGGQFKVAVVTACGTPCFLVEKSK